MYTILNLKKEKYKFHEKQLNKIYNESFLSNNNNFIGSLFGNNKYFIYALCENDILLSVFIGLKVLNDIDIISIFTNISHRRKGHAKTIIKYVLNKYINHNFFLEVSHKNIEANRLYDSLGFIDVGIRENYYKKDDHAIIKSIKV